MLQGLEQWFVHGHPGPACKPPAIEIRHDATPLLARIRQFDVTIRKFGAPVEDLESVSN